MTTKINFGKLLFIAATTILIGLSCSRTMDQMPVRFNLSDKSQQEDFQNYLESSLNILNDSLVSSFFKGYNLSNISETEKRQIANNMAKDQGFMKKLNIYIEFTKSIEKKYKASSFTKEQWYQIAKFGVNKGIYFLPGLKEKVRLMEEKSAGASQGKANVAGTTCSDQVENDNAELAETVAALNLNCLVYAEFPIVAAICFAGVEALYLEENSRINSNEYWCDCMIANYGTCVY